MLPASSTLHLPTGPWLTVLDALCAHFGAIPRATWLDRMNRGLVLDDAGHALGPQHVYAEGLRVHYFREVADEPHIPFTAQVLYCDAHLLVADKPHFLPVMPAGRFVQQTLLTRLVRETGNRALTPLHRIDRDTAGLVLFSTNAATRDHYHALFRDRCITKYYDALAPALPEAMLPLVHRSRLVRGEPFFCVTEVVGAANSETLIEVLERGTREWRYRLTPRSGRKHQLRVHMAALGAPITNDPLYPSVASRPPDDFTRPLQLLAKHLSFRDPLTGELRSFASGLALTSAS